MKRTKFRIVPPASTRKALEANTGNVYTATELRRLMLPNHQAFCLEYVKNGYNAKAAYQKVYKPKGSNESIRASAAALLARPYVQQYVQHLRAHIEETCFVSKARQLAEYAKIAYSSFGNLHNSWIERKDWEQLLKTEPDAIDAIKNIETKVIRKHDDVHGVIDVEFVKIELHSKLDALKKIDELMQYNKPTQLEILPAVDITKYSEAERNALLAVARKTEM